MHCWLFQYQQLYCMYNASLVSVWKIIQPGMGLALFQREIFILFDDLTISILCIYQ